ncbi:cobyrinate a,c-diamide synthase [Thalassobacter stenotrophicus]|uniref:Hydrogenobyrinate a,c-diamide synthase n=2 Tax=Thalassobacter stenotrophicus TaxID=266809 RepID=A0A0P1F0P9_9RHOB|nr:cobyrinate a,c-diamide synthase [Thalassobacter stenotrophicus]PVZ48132.1 cobyrinate a,c-diamide synthase [Thalassobacter stenotrophicus]CUH61009.1 Cobyrinic acid A,C-diamide synthase [Thalassobacter stenotrophicus]SHI54765.1 cobyrinic acid a,c-diamide synthase [Thalassobacter stenotrophicus DSM 16310]
MKGLILAAPTSGSGKTTVTLGLLRALSEAGVNVRGAKSGPDYIDPRFHEAACGRPCMSLDAWAMGPEQLRALATKGTPELLLVEGAMGLFDGAPPAGRGSTADLARTLGLPVVLVVDAGRMAHSIAPLVAGFANFHPEVTIAGVILNRVGSPRHTGMLRAALEPLGIPVLGAVPRVRGLEHPDRHLGLVQAQERPDLDAFLDRAGDTLALTVDLDKLHDLAAPIATAPTPQPAKPPAQRIALASDAAFDFAYPHLLDAWRAAGAQVIPFSPLADQAVPECDLVYLPGGYPELHAGKLAASAVFLHSLRRASETAQIYGECGGYMVLGQTLVDATGTPHAMAGLLNLETSFSTRKLHLGYRRLHADHGAFPGAWTGHEFHYATTVRAKGEPLFTAQDAEGTKLSPMGLRDGAVSGSFAHLIAPL